MICQPIPPTVWNQSPTFCKTFLLHIIEKITHHFTHHCNRIIFQSHIIDEKMWLTLHNRPYSFLWILSTQAYMYIYTLCIMVGNVEDFVFNYKIGKTGLVWSRYSWLNISEKKTFTYLVFVQFCESSDLKLFGIFIGSWQCKKMACNTAKPWPPPR